MLSFKTRGFSEAGRVAVFVCAFLTVCAILIVSVISAGNLSSARAATVGVTELGIIQLETELYCSNGKAGAFTNKKTKAGTTNQFVSLKAYFTAKNKGKALTAKQNIAVNAGAKSCASLKKSETLYVDAKLKKCGVGFYSVKKRTCEKKAAKVTAYKTITEAVKLAGPGDKILIRAGTYKEAVTIRRPGVSTAPLSIENYPGEAVLLDGQHKKASAFLISGSEATDLKTKYAANYIAISGLEMANFTGSVIKVLNAKGILVENNIIRDSSAAGIEMGAGAQAATIWGNLIERVGGHGVQFAENNWHVAAYNIVAQAGLNGFLLANNKTVTPSYLHHNGAFLNGQSGFSYQGNEAEVSAYVTGFLSNASLYNGAAGFSFDKDALLQNSISLGNAQNISTSTQLVSLINHNFVGNSDPSSLSPNTIKDVAALNADLQSKDTFQSGLSLALVKSQAEKDVQVRLGKLRADVGILFVLPKTSSLIDFGVDAESTPYLDLVGQAPVNRVDVGLIEFVLGAEGNGIFSHTPGLPRARDLISIARKGTVLPGIFLRDRYSNHVQGPTPTPTATATPTPSGEVFNFFDSTKSIYSGSNPPQQGVGESVIKKERLAIIRGKVRDSMGPVSNAIISSPDHPEFGVTVTKADGSFDFAVNGGGTVWLRFEAQSYLTSERSARAPLEDFVVLEEVVLTKRDPLATVLTLSTLNLPILTQSTTQVDDDGDGRGPKSRTSRIMVRPGTTAKAMLPNGTAVALDTITVRATEYTVGTDGLKRMPAPLPATTAYTYAVELSIDEADALGAKTVNFSTPVFLYVENFLNFPVGRTVPVGFFDRSIRRWIPSANGRVISIISKIGGIAQVDLDGDRLADSPGQLSALGFTNEELQTLASSYAVGVQLWRTPIPHFSPWDCNWPYAPPSGATGPRGEPPSAGDSSEDENSCKISGSIIECENRVLRETIPLAGTNVTLNYSNARAPGFKSPRVIRIPLAGSIVPPGLIQAEVEVSYLGGVAEKKFTTVNPSSEFLFEWDGKDRNGKEVLGEVTFTIRVGYEYRATYYEPSALEAAFGSFSGVSIGANRTRLTTTIWQADQVVVLKNYKGVGALGGWTLSPQHRLAIKDNKILFGDGTWGSINPRDLKSGYLPKLAARRSYYGLFTENQKAADADVMTFWYPQFGSDGSVYFLDTRFPGLAPDFTAIRKITPLGRIVTVLHNGDVFGAPGEPPVRFIDNFRLDDQDNIYFIDTPFQGVQDNVLVRKYTNSGSLVTIAGRTSSFPPMPMYNGAIATNVNLGSLNTLLPSSDGSLYLGRRVYSSNEAALLRIDLAGRIADVAGGGALINTDNSRALSVSLASAWEINEAPDGSLNFIGHLLNGGVEVLRLNAGGILQRIMAKTSSIFAATSTANFNSATGDIVSYTTMDRQGRLYFIGSENGPGINYSAVFRVEQNGDLLRLAGTDNPVSPEPEPLTPFALSYEEGISSLSVDPRGNVIFSRQTDRLNEVLNKPQLIQISTDLLTKLGDGYSVPSDDGSEIYYFASDGRHLRTTDALTDSELEIFSYDPSKKLSSIRDTNGNQIGVTGWGTTGPSEITSAYGRITRLEYDSNGYLSRTLYPDGTSYVLTHTPQGLLSTLRDPKGNLHTFTYDSDGRLTKDQDPASGAQSLTQKLIKDGRTVEISSKIGRKRLNTYTRTLGGLETKKLELPTGEWSKLETQPDGSSISTQTNGVTQTTKIGTDPRFISVVVPKTTQVKVPSGITKTTNFSRTYSEAPPRTLSDEIDVNGRTFKRSYDYLTRRFTARSPLGRTSLSVLDSDGRISQTQVANFYPVSWFYDGRGRVSKISSGDVLNLRTTSFAYDAYGQLSALTDGLGNITSYKYDSSGRNVEETLPDSSAVTYTYDENGNVSSIGPPGKPLHLFSYTPLDARESYTPPTLPGGALATLYEYDADRDLKKITRPSGEELSFNYGGVTGRLDSVTLPTGTINYSYSGSTGQLLSQSGPYGISQSYTYDGVLVKRVTQTGAVAGTIDYTYDNFFRITEQKINNADPVAFTYDNDGLLVSVGAMTITRNLAAGYVTGTTLGNVKDTYTVSQFGELATYEAKFGATQLFSETINSRDRLGRITKRTEVIEGVSSVYDYTYDSRGRLSQVDKNGALYSHYEYDANGNRVLQTGHITVAGIYDAQDRLISFGAKTYTFDDDGDLSKVTDATGQTSYDYDARGSLRSVKTPADTISYQIDPSGRRAGKIVNGVLKKSWLYQSTLQPVAELNADGSVNSRFIYSSTRNVPDYLVNSGTVYRVISDRLGSVRLVINNATGEVQQRIEYDEFGWVLSDTNPGFQPFGYAGGIYDHETRLIRFGARDYDAETGRWTAKDPLFFGGSDTNLFGYTQNNPISNVDALGLFPTSEEGIDAYAAQSRYAQWLATHGDPMRYKPAVKPTMELYGSPEMQFVLTSGGLAGLFLGAPEIAIPCMAFGVLSNLTNLTLDPSYSNTFDLTLQLGGNLPAPAGPLIDIFSGSKSLIDIGKKYFSPNR